MSTYELDLLRRWPLARHLDGQPLQFMFADRCGALSAPIGWSARARAARRTWGRSLVRPLTARGLLTAARGAQEVRPPAVRLPRVAPGAAGHRPSAALTTTRRGAAFAAVLDRRMCSRRPCTQVPLPGVFGRDDARRLYRVSGEYRS